MTNDEIRMTEAIRNRNPESRAIGHPIVGRDRWETYTVGRLGPILLLSFWVHSSFVIRHSDFLPSLA